MPTRFATSTPLSAEELSVASFRAPRPSELDRPLKVESRRVSDALSSLGIDTVGQLLMHLPTRMRASRTIDELKIGEHATIAVEVREISRRSTRRRVRGRPLTLVEASVSDGTGTISATFFNQPWLLERYEPGTRLLLHGSLRKRGFGVSHHAIAEAAVGGGEAPGADAGAGAVAHYPATDGVSSTQILTLVQRCAPALSDVVEPLPAALRARLRQPSKTDALTAMHFPRDAEDHEHGRARLAFEELLLGQLALRRRRALQARVPATALAPRGALADRWLAESLPFRPTDDQLAAMHEIDADLTTARPMQRLLMGEVGSGKTVVALYAMLRAVENGLQAALMAPTETLAQQHFATLSTLAPEGLVSAALLTGSTPAARRADLLGKLANGQLQLLVGTHALIVEDVTFSSLGVVVVDEQHRFGVRQRTALGDVSPVPHVLHMTATPIPRTLALTRYGDLDVTRLTQLPSGRKPISTHVASSAAERARAYERVREEVRSGRQAFVVCPLVSESEQLSAKAASAEYERLRDDELSGLRLVLLHGQMKAKEKQEAIGAFASGGADVLVCTTVIEVGIDVPNATVMLIEDAERYGIAQLHQLRGRVGRGGHASLCLLFGEKGSPRLRALSEHSDGFQLAEIDLRLREAGDLQDDGRASSPRQSGAGGFAVARLPEDERLLQAAASAASALLHADADLSAPEHALLCEALRPVPA